MKFPHSLALALCAAANTADAADFCVATTDDLIAALYEAEGNSESDTIKLVQGTYYGNFFYSNASPYALTLGGGYTAGCVSRQIKPNKTVLDAGGAGTVLILNSTIGSAQFTVSNVTVRNGGAGGLDLRTDKASRRSKIALTQVRILNNQGVGANLVAKSVSVAQGWFNYSSPDWGLVIDAATTATVQYSQANANYRGGAVISADTIKLIGDTFNGNGLTNCVTGGGVTLNGKQITVSKSSFTSNSAYGHYWFGYCGGFAGGANITASSGLLLDGNTFLDNLATYSGGAVYFQGGQATIKNNQVRRNTSGTGGGLWLSSSSSALLANNVVSGNHGGGVYLNAASASLSDNLIYGNSANEAGGVRVQAASITLTNNTITGNSAGNSGGAKLLLSANTDTANVYNNLIWSNTATVGGDLYIDNDGNNDLVRSVVNLQNNDFNRAKPSGLYIKRTFPIPASNLNNVDPLFVDAGNGDYHLQPGSPVIDLGNDTAPDLPAIDMDGEARIQGAHVDIGADEFEP